jgi:hypothetical protein
MQYAILCYNDEDVVWSWSKEEDAAVMAGLSVVQERLIRPASSGRRSARCPPSPQRQLIGRASRA